MNESDATRPEPIEPEASGAAAGTAPGARARAYRRAAWALVLGLLAFRVVYLVWLCPWDLVADEAYYWNWARWPALSYFSKGPGVAWTIVLSTRLLGVSEWSIRLPAALASAVGALAIGRLATACSGGNRRVGFFAVLAFCLLPCFFFFGHVMTIDGPFVTCWVLACWAAWAVFARLARGKQAWAPWVGLGAAVGVGFLYKYTILLLVPGLVLYILVARRRLRWNRRATLGMLLSIAVASAVVSPVLIWNWLQGWPTVRHILDHLRLTQSGRGRQTGWSYRPIWTLEFLGGQIGVVGPMIVLMIAAAAEAVRRRRRKPRGWPAQQMMICFAAPILAFFFLTTFTTDVEANWPIAAYVSLVVLVAQFVAARPGRHAGPEAAARHADRKISVRYWWYAGVIYCLVCAGGIMMPGAVAALPVVGKFVPMHRIAGARDLLDQVQPTLDRVRRTFNAEPVIVTFDYSRASMLAFYLPGRPKVYCAAELFDPNKTTAYSFFRETRLDDPALLGRTFVLYRMSAKAWRRVFRFDRIEPAPDGAPVFIGFGFRGLVITSRQRTGHRSGLPFGGRAGRR